MYETKGRERAKRYGKEQITCEGSKVWKRELIKRSGDWEQLCGFVKLASNGRT